MPDPVASNHLAAVVISATISGVVAILITILQLARFKRVDNREDKVSESKEHRESQTAAIAAYESVTSRLDLEVQRLSRGLAECLNDKRQMNKEMEALHRRIAALEKGQRGTRSGTKKQGRN